MTSPHPVLAEFTDHISYFTSLQMQVQRYFADILCQIGDIIDGVYLLRSAIPGYQWAISMAFVGLASFLGLTLPQWVLFLTKHPKKSAQNWMSSHLKYSP